MNRPQLKLIDTAKMERERLEELVRDLSTALDEAELWIRSCNAPHKEGVLFAIGEALKKARD